jgi:hypothetical protein
MISKKKLTKWAHDSMDGTARLDELLGSFEGHLKNGDFDEDPIEVIARLHDLRGMIERSLPGGRSISRALTKIDEAEMWFDKALKAGV